MGGMASSVGGLVKASEAGVVHLVKWGRGGGKGILGSKHGGLKGPEAGATPGRTVVAC